MHVKFCLKTLSHWQKNSENPRGINFFDSHCTSCHGIIIIITDLYSAFRSEDTEALERWLGHGLRESQHNRFINETQHISKYMYP